VFGTGSLGRAVYYTILFSTMKDGRMFLSLLEVSIVFCLLLGSRGS
jgi:hypothetical protein